MSAEQMKVFCFSFNYTEYNQCVQDPHKIFWNFRDLESIIDATIEHQREATKNGVK